MEIGIPPERSTHNHNLPASVSSFIGREQELREIRVALARASAYHADGEQAVPERPVWRLQVSSGRSRSVRRRRVVG